MSEKQEAVTASTDASSNPTGSGPKAVIKNVDMSEERQQEAVDVTSTALEKYNIEKDIAAQIKKEFDRRHGPTWHVVVGKNFGSYVTHGECPRISLYASSTRRCLARLGNRAHRSRFSAETKHFIYFYVGTLAILIWKS